MLLSSIVDQEKLAHAEQPHRFDLKKVGDIINDVKAALAMVPEEMVLAKGKLITVRTVVSYDCEGLRYDGAYFTEKAPLQGAEPDQPSYQAGQRWLPLQDCNDGGGGASTHRRNELVPPFPVLASSERPMEEEKETRGRHKWQT